MTKIVIGDLMKADEKYIAHQVNCKGVMGAGIAKQFKSKYPEMFKHYQNICKKHNSNVLGGIMTFPAAHKTIINMFAQDGYGRDKTYTDYKAFQMCLNEIKSIMDNDLDSEIAFPYGIGCGLAGGEWDKISKMIDDTLPADRVAFYKLPA